MRHRGIAGLLLLTVLGCASPQPAGPEAATTLPDPPGLREQGLLLLMADRRYYDSFTVGSIRFENPDLAVSLALALGRIGDSRGLPVLHTLLVEGKPAVRREAAFAVGLIADPASVRHLLGAVTDTDPETAVWAVAGLAEMGVAVDRVLEVLGAQTAAQRWQRLAPYLFRFTPAELQSVAVAGLQAGRQEERSMAAFALARTPQLESLGDLRSLVDSHDPWVRGWAARALGQVGDRQDLARLRPLLDEDALGPPIQSLRAARRLVAKGMAAPPPDWQPKLLALLDDGRTGVSLTAMESAAAWLLDEELADALEARVKNGSPRQKEVALTALAEGADPRAGDWATRLVTSPDERLRILSANVATVLKDSEILQYLALDDSPEVRGAALAGMLQGAGEEIDVLAVAALEDVDPGVRAQVMEWLVDRPVAPADLISRAILGSGSREVPQLRISGIQALLARGLAEPLERGLVVENLESLARVGEYPARVEAARSLVELGRPEPAVGAAGSRKSTTTYMQVVLQTDKEHLVQIETRHGDLQIELECSQARMTCLNFLQLARQGFFDGQVFHRVIPDFVVQAGDPRGDGWGGPGYTIRDELTRTPFARGVVGMASSGPDTAGSQFFITLSRQPHLDGRYTVFGRVVGGEAMLDRLVQGDRLERVTVVR